MSLQIKTSIALACLCFLVAFGTIRLTASTAYSEPKDDDIRVFMRAKLTSSQKLLEGLVTEDFERIQKGAAEMKMLSKAKSWPTADDKVYNHHNTAFQMHCDKIVKLAKEKNLEGVKFTYLQLTTSCVDCHSYVRGKFKIKKPVNKKGPVQLIPTYWDDKK